MKIATGIKSHNPLEHMRMELLEETLRTVTEAFPEAYRILYLNGADDGSEDVQTELAEKHDTKVIFGGLGEPCTPGEGALAIGDWLRAEGDIIVFSDDDMAWRPGAADKLREMWAEAPDDLIIVSGLLEPVWHWNTPRETVACGEVNVLVRDSCPGAAWSFRAKDWPRIKEVMPLAFGYDYDVCCRLRDQGLRVGQVDLADHEGWGSSTHENAAIEAADMRELDRERWGV
jgi:hypothetical protein